jgi:uncharacterized protein YdhG (YjbR/CyaY superfamily)
MLKDIAEYHLQFDSNVQKKLKELHTIIKEMIPRAEEIISYKMPAFKQNKVLVYYAGYKNHIGFYPTAKPIEVFKNQLLSFKHSKGAIQFPIDQPLPKKLIQDIVKFRLEDSEATTPKSTVRR